MKLLLLIVMAFSFAMKADVSSCEKAKLYFEYPSNGFISEGLKFKVVFGSKNISINEVLSELASREGISGIEEKRKRNLE